MGNAFLNRICSFPESILNKRPSALVDVQKRVHVGLVFVFRF